MAKTKTLAADHERAKQGPRWPHRRGPTASLTLRLLWSGFAAACASQPPPPEAATAAALPLPAPPAAQAPSAPKGAPPTDAPAEPQKNTDGAWRCPDKAAWPAGMACVEGGRFVRGDAAEGQPDERGSGEVFVDTFFMDTHEVNNAAYQHCIDAGQCKKPRPFRGFGAAQQPVVAVSWYDAVAHCQMLGKRLPTESEWERAARGPKNTRYPWGDEARGCEALTMEVKGRGPGKGKGCGQNLTRPVGSYAPGHWGLYDMAGNVHEWVLDWYSPCYAGCKKECGQDCMGPNPRGPCEGAESCPKRELRSVRGGSWYWPLERARGAARRGSEPRNRQPHRFGFRCAQNFEPAGAAGATADAGRARPRPTGVATQPTATRPKPAGSAQPAKAHHSGAAALHDAARPLPAQLSAALSAVAHEQTPATTRFYYKSNEWRHDLLRRDLQGRGGALIAVAADPSYTLAAMAGSSLIAIIDFDRRIRLLHKIYGALIPASPSPAALIQRFSAAEEEPSIVVLDQALQHDPDNAQAKALFRKHRASWYDYLRKVQGLTRDGQPGSWLASARDFAHVRQLHQHGRVFAYTADLQGEQSIRALGRALRQHQVPVGVVYLSNAEQFVRYSRSFIANMKALPTHTRTVLVRTMRHKFLPYAEDDKWAYIVHEFPDFLARLDTRAYGRSFAFAPDIAAGGAPFRGKNGLSRITAATPRAMAERKRR